MTIWWVADKMSTLFSGGCFSINTLQQWVLHTCSFICQNRKESIFLLLVTGKGKCIIYTNANTRGVWKCSKELCIPMFLQKKNCYCILIFSFFEKGHLDKIHFSWKEKKISKRFILKFSLWDSVSFPCWKKLTHQYADLLKTEFYRSPVCKWTQKDVSCHFFYAAGLLKCRCNQQYWVWEPHYKTSVFSLGVIGYKNMMARWDTTMGC